MRQLQESTWDIVDLVDVNLTVVAGTTVTTVGTVTVIATVVATAAKTVITTAATGTGAIAGALLQRATTDAAEVSPGALPRVNAAPHAVLTEEITKLLLPIHLLKRPRAGKGQSGFCKSTGLVWLPHVSFLLSLCHLFHISASI
jgi:hypothetical protein